MLPPISEMENIRLERGSGTAAVISTFGATLTSWTVDGTELLFVSPNSKLDGTKAIRGGVPVCFPAFGPWEGGPQHGFARTAIWQADTPTSNQEVSRKQY